MPAQVEPQRLTTGTAAAAGEAALMVASGASTAQVAAGDRREVRANARRLSKR